MVYTIHAGGYHRWRCIQCASKWATSPGALSNLPGHVHIICSLLAWECVPCTIFHNRTYRLSNEFRYNALVKMGYERAKGCGMCLRKAEGSVPNSENTIASPRHKRRINVLATWCGAAEHFCASISFCYIETYRQCLSSGPLKPHACYTTGTWTALNKMHLNSMTAIQSLTTTKWTSFRTVVTCSESVCAAGIYNFTCDWAELMFIIFNALDLTSIFTFACTTQKQPQDDYFRACTERNRHSINYRCWLRRIWNWAVQHSGWSMRSRSRERRWVGDAAITPYLPLQVRILSWSVPMGWLLDVPHANMTVTRDEYFDASVYILHDP